MSNEIATVGVNTHIIDPSQIDDLTNKARSLSPESIHMLRTMYYPGADDATIKMAHAMCLSRNVDHTMRPVYAVPTWDGRQKKEVYQLWPSIHLYRVIASRSMHAGTSEPEYGPMTTITGIARDRGQSVERALEIPEWASVTVKRVLPGGIIAEFTAKVWASEVGKVSGQWLSMPRHMLGIRAESHALRKGFPEVGGMPTWEEAGQYAEMRNDPPAMSAPKRKVESDMPPPADDVPMASPNQIKVLMRLMAKAGIEHGDLPAMLGHDVADNLEGMTLADARIVKSQCETLIAAIAEDGEMGDRQ